MYDRPYRSRFEMANVWDNSGIPASRVISYCSVVYKTAIQCVEIENESWMRECGVAELKSTINERRGSTKLQGKESTPPRGGSISLSRHDAFLFLPVEHAYRSSMGVSTTGYPRRVPEAKFLNE